MNSSRDELGSAAGDKWRERLWSMSKDLSLLLLLLLPARGFLVDGKKHSRKMLCSLVRTVRDLSTHSNPEEFLEFSLASRENSNRFIIASSLETNPVRSRALIQTNNDLHSSSSSSSSLFLSRRFVEKEAEEEGANCWILFSLYSSNFSVSCCLSRVSRALSLLFSRKRSRAYAPDRSTSLIVSPTVIRQKRVVPLAPHLDTAHWARERPLERERHLQATPSIVALLSRLPFKVTEKAKKLK